MIKSVVGTCTSTSLAADLVAIVFKMALDVV